MKFSSEIIAGVVFIFNLNFIFEKRIWARSYINKNWQLID